MKWNNVKSKMPEIRERVLMRVTCGDKFNIEEGYFNGKEWVNCWYATRKESSYPVTHWMTLPEPPKE